MAPGSRVWQDRWATTRDADKLYQRRCDLKSLIKQTTQSRQVIENKGPEKRFFSSQSR